MDTEFENDEKRNAAYSILIVLAWVYVTFIPKMSTNFKTLILLLKDVFRISAF